MRYFDWNKNKNSLLKEKRGICFEDVQSAIREGKLLDDFENPNKKRYPNQRMLIVEIDNYAYYVPYVEGEKELFLKTMFPSRKATKKYITGGKNR